MGIAPVSGTTAYSAMDEVWVMWKSSSPPRRSRRVPSSIAPERLIRLATSQRYDWPRRQYGQRLHWGRQESTT